MADFPCLFGRVALRPEGGTAAPPAPTGATLVHGEPGVAQVYSVGSPTLLHYAANGDSANILFGRLYAPKELYDDTPDSESILTRMAQHDLRDVEGSFIVVRIRRALGSASMEISCDKYGTRRLLYHRTADSLYFATHLYGLRKLWGRTPTAISEDALLHYYNFGFTAADQTLLADVQKLPGGCSLRIQDGACALDRYFDLRSLHTPGRYAGVDESAICRDIDNALTQGLRRRTPPNGRVAIAFSGGVDSGYIAQNLVRNGARTTAYNLAYSAFYDENDRVDALSRILDLAVRKRKLESEEIIGNFESVNAQSSEPVGFNGTVMRFVAEAAMADGHSTLFDGDGTDRLFLGMNRYLGYKRILAAYRILRQLGLASLTDLAFRISPHSELRKLHILFANWRMAIPAYPERQIGGLTRFDATYERRIFELAVKPYHDRFLADFGTGDFGLYFTYQALQMCPETFFHDASEIQTALGLSPVSGFFSDAMVSLALDIPTAWKLRAGTTKWILRKAAALHTDARYWMLPKIGLQSAFAFAMQSDAGQEWRDKQRAKMHDSAEYRRLKAIVPKGQLQADRLISLITWKQGLA